MIIGIGIPFGRRGGFTGVLDLYPNASAAYSLRKLRKAYTGAAVRIRRSSDNAETDIGFLSNGDFNSAAAVAFCGVGNGFITTWYDQSGNAQNVTETTGANQPQIVASGVVLLVNSKPCIQFDGINDKLVRAAFGTGKTVSNFTVFRYTSLLNNPTIFSAGLLGGSTARIFGFVTSAFQRAFAGTNLNFGTTNVVNTQYLFFSYFAGASSQISRNGSASVTGNAGTQDNTDLSIGCNASLSGFTTGEIQELIFYSSDQTANKTAIETLINSYYAIY
jgi:hypothetical protein